MNNPFNRDSKSSKINIKALAIVLIFLAVMASMVLGYNVKCDFGVKSGFHLDLSPSTSSTAVDSNNNLNATGLDLSPLPDATSVQSE